MIPGCSDDGGFGEYCDGKESTASENLSDSRAKGQFCNFSSWEEVIWQSLMREPKGSSSPRLSISATKALCVVLLGFILGA